MVDDTTTKVMTMTTLQAPPNPAGHDETTEPGSLRRVAWFAKFRVRRGAPRLARGSTAQVKLTKHACERMSLRGVSSRQVRSVVSAPSRRFHDPVNQSMRLEGDFGRWVLKVWVVAPWTGRDLATVKTTAWEYQAELRIPTSAIGAVIGREGRTVTQVEHLTGTRVQIGHDGRVQVRGRRRGTVRAAMKEIRKIADRP